MSTKKTREEAIRDLTLALLYLTRFPDGEGNHFEEMAWKYDFDAFSQLDRADLIVNPRRGRGGDSKYVYLTEQGRKRARELIADWNIEDQPIYERFEFRCIRPEEAPETAKIEEICFPPNEACSYQHMIERAGVASDLFLVAVDRQSGKIAGFLNGIATDEMQFRDEFFTDASLHDPNGRNVMLLGLDVLPEYRKGGLGRELMFSFARRERERDRKRLVLTCHSRLVKMYRKFGFRDLGESASEWGGEKWHEMDMILNL